MDTDTWRTVAAVVGALGGVSGFSTLIYTVRKDRRAAARDVEDKITTHLDQVDGEHRLTVHYMPRDGTERLILRLYCDPPFSLMFHPEEISATEASGKRRASPNPDGRLTLKLPFGRFMHGSVTARAYVRKNSDAPAPHVRIEVILANTDKVVAKTKRLINV